MPLCLIIPLTACPEQHYRYAPPADRENRWPVDAEELFTHRHPGEHRQIALAHRGHINGSAWVVHAKEPSRHLACEVNAGAWHGSLEQRQRAEVDECVPNIG